MRIWFSKRQKNFLKFFFQIWIQPKFPVFNWVDFRELKQNLPPNIGLSSISGGGGYKKWKKTRRNKILLFARRIKKKFLKHINRRNLIWFNVAEFCPICLSILRSITFLRIVNIKIHIFLSTILFRVSISNIRKMLQYFTKNLDGPLTSVKTL